MVTKIISGGQTGADQGGLIAGQTLGLKTGGWAPKGFRTDAGPKPELLSSFGLQEHPSPYYKERTHANARDSDGTVWFGNTYSPGFKCTRAACVFFKKPLLVNPKIEAFQDWLWDNRIYILNVAGNRERTHPGIQDLTTKFLVAALKT